MTVSTPSVSLSPCCSIDGCGGSLIAKGWCWKHYQANRRHGTPVPQSPAPGPKGKQAAAGRRQAPRLPLYSDTVKTKFLEKVDQTGGGLKPARGLGPCWLWTGSLSRGYGVFVWQGRNRRAHRYAYRAFAGPLHLPELDHVCHSVSTWCRGGTDCWHRRCVNPKHLEPTTKTENVRRIGNRGNAYVRSPQVTTWARCRNGHTWSEETTLYNPAGGRECRECIAGFY